MVGERRSPGVQHGDYADPGAQVFGIGRDGDHCFGGRLEQEAVDHGLILIGDRGDGRGRREHNMYQPVDEVAFG